VKYRWIVDVFWWIFLSAWPGVQERTDSFCVDSDLDHILFPSKKSINFSWRLGRWLDIWKSCGQVHMKYCGWAVVEASKTPSNFREVSATCGLQGCNNRPIPFPCRLYKVTKPGFVLHLSVFLLCCCLLGRLFMYCYFSLVLILLVKLSVLAKWLARKTPLRKPNHGKELSPQSRGWRIFMLFLVYCSVSLFVLFSSRTSYISYSRGMI